MTAILGRSIAGVAALLALIGASDSPRTAFAVGALRHDGIVIPFAAFDGKRWGKYWPTPSVELTVPISLQSVPKGWWGPTRALESWQAWTAGEPQTLRIVQPDWVNVHCVRQIGLQTDYRVAPPTPPRTEQPYPKDGLVVSPPQPVERIDLVSPTAPDVRAFATELREAFNKAERDVQDNHGPPVSRRGREGIEPTVEAVYAFGDTARVCHVEAVRQYRQLGHRDECEAASFGTGWFVRENGRVRPLTMVVDLLRCDRYGASYMLPLGMMRIDGHLFWLAQFSGWDHERFVVLEIKPKAVEVRANTWGGGCGP